MERIPNISKELIELLERLFPSKNPSSNTRTRDVWRAAGHRDVIDRLKDIAADQEGEPIEGLRSHVLLQSAVGSDAGQDRNPGAPSATAARTPGSPGNRLRSDAER